ncbi:hypothetical protein G6F59_016201 [Rhizopus arrhizus]|nr:hypothetical protein G6F59_016201 [Rhizopus arrhizus]
MRSRPARSISMPRRPAMAVRWTMPFVEPPIDSSTRKAFSMDLPLMIWSGVSRDAAMATAVAPVRSATRTRSAVTAGADAPPATIMPSASVMQAMVLAVPITEQVPTLATSWLFTSAISGASISSAR